MKNEIMNRFKNRIQGRRKKSESVEVNILDKYTRSLPSPQNAIDIFAGEWTSKLPEPYSHLSAGSLSLFEDERIMWAIEKLGGIKDKTILELGPLEGGHTYMLERFGASSIISIEANTRAYLKCLIIKELLELKKGKFLCGDFSEYLRFDKNKFDIIFASGVLYHMQNPVELIYLLSQTTDRLFLWTHYFDRDIIYNNINAISQNLHYRDRFTGTISLEYSGFNCILYRQEYKASLDNPGFCGGSNSFSYWMSRRDIISCLNYFGYENIEIAFDEPQHVNGPAFALTATKNK